MRKHLFGKWQKEKFLTQVTLEEYGDSAVYSTADHNRSTASYGNVDRGI